MVRRLVLAPSHWRRGAGLGEIWGLGIGDWGLGGGAGFLEVFAVGLLLFGEVGFDVGVIYDAVAGKVGVEVDAVGEECDDHEDAEDDG